MKLPFIAVLSLGLVAQAVAIDKPELETRINKLSAKFDAMQSKSDKAIPADTLRKAKAIVLLDRTKAGFIFAYQGGGGVAMLRDPKSGNLSAPAFFRADEPSLGFQIGAQQSFLVILFMHTNAVQSLTDGKVSFGGEASGTAGNTSDGVEGTVEPKEQLTLVYSDKSGLYGGAAIKGSWLAPDTDANVAYYGEYLSTKEILQEKKVKPSGAAAKLISRIEESSKKSKD